MRHFLRRRGRGPALTIAAATAIVALLPAPHGSAQTGAELAFHRDGSVFVSAADGSGARIVRRRPAADVDVYPLSWLPNGNLLTLDVSDCTVTREVRVAEQTSTAFPYPEDRGCPQDVTVSPDGRLVAFSSYVAFLCRPTRKRSCSDVTYRLLEEDIAQRYVRAGQGDPLWFVRFAPDGLSLYGVKRSFEDTASTPGELVRIDLVTGRQSTVAPDVDAIDVAPDGNLAIQRGDDIMIMNSEGGTRTIAQGEGPAFSEDGTTVFFSTPEGIWRVPVGGGRAELVVKDALAPVPFRAFASAVPKPPPGTLAYIRGGDVFVADPSGERRVTEAGGFGSLAWASDGTALVAVRNGSPQRISLDGADAEPEPFPVGQPKISGIAIAPDGMVAFIAEDRRGIQQVWLGGGDTEPRQLTKGTRRSEPDGGPPAFSELAFSARGDVLLVTAGRTSDTRRLLAFATAGGSPAPVPQVPIEGRVAMDAAGTVYWTAGTLEGDTQTQVRIQAGRIDGEQLADVRTISPSLDDSFGPALSPDGRAIAFVRRPGRALTDARNARPDVWIARVDGSEVYRVAENAHSPVWHPLGTVGGPASGGGSTAKLIALPLLLALIAGAAAFLIKRRPTLMPTRDGGLPEEIGSADDRICPVCTALIEEADPYCRRCGIRRDPCGCVYYFGTRRITCWPHVKEEQTLGAGTD